MIETWIRGGRAAGLALVAASVLSGYAAGAQEIAVAGTPDVRVAWIDVNLREPCVPDVAAVAVMGAASPGSGTAWIFCDVVAQTMEPRPSSMSHSRVELGVAVGRVLAHEVVHILALRLPHALVGLMAARWDPSMLTRRGLLGDRRVREAVRRGLLLDPPDTSIEGIASLASSEEAARHASVIAPRRGCHEQFLGRSVERRRPELVGLHVRRREATGRRRSAGPQRARLRARLRLLRRRRGAQH
jgi:hypothetical protein